jgi:hypothetical protein
MRTRTLAVAAAAIAAGSLWIHAAGTEDDPIGRARAFYAGQPRYLQPVMGDPRVPGLSDLRSETCGMCHKEIYQEWKISTHAKAFRHDAQFLDELEKHDGTHEGHGGEAAWICMNCHTPYESQLEKLVVGLEDGNLGKPIYVPNPNFDPKMQNEAIGCATCHVRDGTIIGPYGDTRAPHATKKDDSLLSSQTCTDCHQANAHLEDVALACLFDTGVEHGQTAEAAAGETCQTCHMPEIERPAANFPVSPKRKTRRHFFGGSLIPKKPEFAAEVAKMREHFEDGLTATWVAPPAQFAAGQEVEVVFAIRNEHAGHMLPSGDPERFLIVRGEALRGDGERLAVREEEIGAKYEWNPVRKVSDNRLARGERREYALKFEVPASGEVKLRLVAEKYRMNQENFDYHELEGRYVRGITFFDETKSIPIVP